MRCVSERAVRAIEVTALTVVGVAFYGFVAAALAGTVWMLWQAGGWWLLLAPAIIGATVAAIVAGALGRDVY